MKRVAIVLCGGKSSRMGRPKAWLPWFGRTMIEHVVERLRPSVDRVWVVTSRDLDLPALNAETVEDRDEALGPLAGIRDGLKAAAADLAFVTSTDAPFLTAEYVTEMLGRGVATAPRSEGHVQVLSAVYPGSAWKEADELLAAGQRRPLSLLERVGFEAIDADAFERSESEGRSETSATPGATHAPRPWQGFNTPEEYLDWARATHPDASARVEILGRAALGLEKRHFDAPIGRLREVLCSLDLPVELRLFDERGRLAKTQIVSLGGRELVRDLELPIGPGEEVGVLDALAGG